LQSSRADARNASKRFSLDQRRRQESNLLRSRVAADRLAVRPRRHLLQEPAVGLEPTSSALRERCPARQASPAWVSSQCWCRANSTEVQSLSPLPRAWPAKRSRASGGSRTRTRPFTRGVLGQSSCTGVVGRGVDSRLRSGTATVTGSHAEPLHHTHHQGHRSQYPRKESNLTFDLRRVACRRHTPRTSVNTPARSRTWACSLGESHDVRFTTRASRSGGWDRTSVGGFRVRRPTVRRPRRKSVTREGVEPSRPVGTAPSRPRVCLFHHLAIHEQWTVEGVEPSSAGCKPTVFPLDDTPNYRTSSP
jgi:hypothetical protein